MSVFMSTLGQMGFLFTLIAAGYLLKTLGVVERNAASVLSKLENNLFIPCLVMGTFIENFTLDRLQSFGKLFLFSCLILAISAGFAILMSWLIMKDKFLRNICTYSLTFSNFGFMGNAVVSALFPDVFLEYLIFTLPLWILIYIWGVPSLLIPKEDGKKGILSSLKALCNPMFIAMLIGMVIGILGVELPNWLVTAVDTSGSCMSPIAMLITGITVAGISLKETFTNVRIYIISFLRLIVMPMIAVGIFYFLNLPKTFEICAVCSLAMPLGLNPVVVPSAYGMDTSAAAGMSLISHLMSAITIPIIFSVAF